MNNINSVMKFHHIGIAVKDMARAKSFYAGLGYKFNRTFLDPLQKVIVALGTHTNAPTIELVSPGKGTSPIDAYLKKAGHYFYHICYSSSDIVKTLRYLQKQGHFICIVKPNVAVALGNKKVSFYFSETTGLIEILEEHSNK